MVLLQKEQEKNARLPIICVLVQFGGEILGTLCSNDFIIWDHEIAQTCWFFASGDFYLVRSWNWKIHGISTVFDGYN